MTNDILFLKDLWYNKPIYADIRQIPTVIFCPPEGGIQQYGYLNSQREL